MEPLEIVEVEETTVACDSGGGALGHPRVFLHMDNTNRVDCPYCGRRYILRPAAAGAAGH